MKKITGLLLALTLMSFGGVALAQTQQNQTQNQTQTKQQNTVPGKGKISGNVIDESYQRQNVWHGISGVTIQLTSADLPTGVMPALYTTKTDRNGYYQFTNLPDGLYDVRQVVPSGWTQVKAYSGTVRVTNGSTVQGVNFADLKNTA